MKIVFMGTPDFAETCLTGLLNHGRQIAAVFTQPDKPQGRKMLLEAPPVKKFAEANHIPVYQPASLRDGSAYSILKEISPDIIIVVAYGKIIPDEIISLPRYGCINVHASLLPKYRGSAPIQWAVLNGDAVTGVTTMYIAHDLDSGDIIDSASTEIGRYETSGELFERLSSMGADLLEKTLCQIESGTVQRTPQNESEATFTTKITKAMSPVDFSQSAYQVVKHICGLQPWPGATASIAGMEVKLIAAKEVEKQFDVIPGQIAEHGKNYLYIACGKGAISVEKLQVPGKKAVSIAEFLNGHKIG